MLLHLVNSKYRTFFNYCVLGLYYIRRRRTRWDTVSYPRVQQFSKAVLRDTSFYDYFPPGEIEFPEVEEPKLPPGVTVRPWRPLSLVTSPLSVAPVAALPAMGPYSPISPAASPETAAKTGNGVTKTEEGSIPSPLLYGSLVSPGGWDPDRLYVSLPSETTAVPETTVDQTDGKNVIKTDTNVDLNQVDLTHIDFDSANDFPEIEILDMDDLDFD